MEIPRVTGVILAGNITQDILVRPVDEFRWGTTTWVDEFVEDMGGNASNCAFALALLGVPARLLGMVGNDVLIRSTVSPKLRRASAALPESFEMTSTWQELRTANRSPA